MFSRSRTWFGGVAKQKNQHSLEHLKYLCNVMSRNQIVSESNRSLLVETLRCVAEILIWGDQNDSSVFDFFLEKNMLSFFLRIMKQKCGSYVCVQLLQTLNILFENIRNETSLYYLLSNNHVNSIIVHKFDFSDEEVLAYYISFLKTLSLKLNNHTIHFFYNEHTNDFPLYTEAIKFFNHSENMVRIAVRTLTLNVYRVDDKSMLSFIRNRTAAPYFSNLVWFIGNHILEIDACVRNDADHQSRNCLSDLVAEHLDHLHYLNDILCLEIEALNQVLVDQLLGRLLLPLYVFSLARERVLSAELMDKPYVSTVVSLFLTTQIYLIITHVPLVQQLAQYILQGNSDIFTIRESDETSTRPPGFSAPPATLEELLGNCTDATCATGKWQDANITDEEKAKMLDSTVPSLLLSSNASEECHSEDLGNRPFFQAVFEALRVDENDYAALFALCFLYALNKNSGVEQSLLDGIFWGVDGITSKRQYNHLLVASLLNIICDACQPSSRIRPVTVELAISLLKRIALRKKEYTDAEGENGAVEMENVLRAEHIAAVDQAREESIVVVRHFYKVFFQGSEEMFLDLFEGEVHELLKKPLNVEYLMMDANLLLPPTGTPMTGIEFTKRLPCGDTERARRSIRVFLLLRSLSLALRQETETQLPLNKSQPCVQVTDVLDLNNSDLIACTVVVKDGSKTRRFLVVDSHQLLLVEPDARRLGWGVAKCVGNLQDVEVSGDKEDSRCLHLTLHRGPEAIRTSAGQRSPILNAKLIFDDHIRCMAAKQRLVKGRYKARQRKMQQVGKLLDLPSSVNGSPPAGSTLHVLRQESTTRRNLMRTGNMALLSSGTSNNTLRTLGRGYPQLPPPRLNSLRPGVATLADNQGVRQRSSSAHPPLNSVLREAIPLDDLDSSLSSFSPTPKASEEQVL